MRLAARSLLLALACLLAAAPSASAHAGHEHILGDVATHGDPRTALPDSLITDPVAADALDPTGAGTLSARGTAPTTWCGDTTSTDTTAGAVFPSSTPQFKMIYAYASDQPNRFDQVKSKLQANVSLFGRYVASQSGGRKALRWDMGSSCGADYVDIQVIALPGTRAFYVPGGAPSFQRVQDDILAQVDSTQAGPRNWTVYADGMFGTNGVAGTATRYTTDAVTGGPHNTGRLVNVTFGPSAVPSGAYAWPGVMFHEIAHNLGAVQDSAPHATLNGHCTDRYDLMCYADGGANGQPSNMTAPCPAGAGDMGPDETLDCGGDDYFNPTPAVGSYLATHWNTYSSAFLGACSADVASQCGLSGDAPDTTAPTNTTPSSGSGWRRTAYSVTLAGEDTGSAVDRFQWKVGSGGAVQTSQTATVPAVPGVSALHTRVGDAAGNWSAWRVENLWFDTTAPVVSVTCPSGWRTAAFDCTVTTSDPESGIASKTLALDGGEGVPLTASTSRVATEGSHTLSASAVNAAGAQTVAPTVDARLDLTDPAVVVTCDEQEPGVHACAATASDGTSGLTGDLRGRLGARAPFTIPAGGRFEVAGPGQLTVAAEDGAARVGTTTLTLAGAAPAPAPAPAPEPGPEPTARPATATPGAPTSPAAPDLPSAPLATAPPPPPPGLDGPADAAAPATSIASLRRGSSSLARGTLLVERAGGRSQATMTLRPRRLARGTWRLEVCVRGTCRSRTVRLARAGRPRPFTTRLTARSGTVRATFTLSRKVGRRFRRQAVATTAATLR